MNDLTKVSPITSLSDAQIDAELFNIKYISNENYENYRLQFITSGQCGAEIPCNSSTLHQTWENRKQKKKFYQN